MTIKNSHNSGNILFIILIAIGLFAALGAAVMDGESTTNKIGEDKAKLAAQDIIAYANAIEGAVQRMLDRGVSENDLCFDYDEYPGGNADYEYAACATESNRVFHPDGGGMRHQIPPAEYFDSAFSSNFRTGQYIISGRTEVYGTPVVNVNDDNTPELIFFAHGLKKDICMIINYSLGLAEKNTDPVIDGSSLSENNSAIYYRNNFPTGPIDIGITKQPRQCVQSSAAGNFPNGYVYFHVLHAR